METFSALLTLCEGNPRVTGGFPSQRPASQRPVTRSFNVFFDVHLNKQLSKQSRCWWFETPWRSLWRHCNDSALKNKFKTNFKISWGHCLYSWPWGPSRATYTARRSASSHNWCSNNTQTRRTRSEQGLHWSWRTCRFHYRQAWRNDSRNGKSCWKWMENIYSFVWLMFVFKLLCSLSSVPQCIACLGAGLVPKRQKPFPAETRRNNKIIMTSKRRRDVVLTSQWRDCCVECPLGFWNQWRR